MKKYKLQHQLPEFEKIADGTTVEDITNMLYSVETIIGKIKISINLSTVGVIAFGVGGTQMVNKAMTSIANNNELSLISIGVLGLGLICSQVFRLKKNINTLGELKEIRGKLLQLKNCAESYSNGYNYDWYDSDDELSRLKEEEKEYLPNSSKNKKLKK